MGKPGDPECWGTSATAAEEGGGGCSSSADCPASDPVCSEFGFCQCECYQPGDAQCWGKGDTVCSSEAAGDGGGGDSGCKSDADCPLTDPVCSEFGFCQCSCYAPGDEECWGRGDTVCS